MSKSLLQFFKSDHLKVDLRTMAKDFEMMALNLYDILPANDEKEMAMRKLLEAKDCAIRALIYSGGK